jgi:hypothetical protein
MVAGVIIERTKRVRRLPKPEKSGNTDRRNGTPEGKRRSTVAGEPKANKQLRRSSKVTVRTSKLITKAAELRAVSLLIVILISVLCVSASAQHKESPPDHEDHSKWKANVISALFPETRKANVEVSIEDGTVTCRETGWRVLVVPLNGITGVARDTGNDYPAADFLMGAATAPSTEHHVFGTRKYQEEMAARVALGGFAFLGLLFPRHREVVRVSWKDENGEHDAEFRMGRKQGRAMIRKLRSETGLEPRDLEQERRDIEAAKKELRRWANEKSHRKRSD